jgi:hypothetical protein
VDGSAIPIDELVSEVETQNRLKILLPFLESTLAAGNQQPAVVSFTAVVLLQRIDTEAACETMFDGRSFDSMPTDTLGCIDTGSNVSPA